MKLVALFNAVGQNPNAQVTADESTILHHAVLANNMNMLLLALNKGGNPYIQNNKNETPLSLAIQRGLDEMVHTMLDNNTDYINMPHSGKGTLFAQAVRHKNFTMAEFLLSRGAGVDVPDNAFETPLHAMSAEGNTEAVAFLLRNNADPNAVDGHGCTPLWHAARNGHLDILKLLMTAGAGSSLEKAATGRKLTPLQAAVERQNKDCVRYLVAQGASGNCADNQGVSCLRSALKHNDIESLGLLVREGGADINSFKTRSIFTVFHDACEKGNIALMEEALRLGADPWVRDPKGQTPLLLAAKAGHKEAVVYLHQHAGLPPKESAYAQHLADALYEAVFYRNSAVARYLVEEMGADVNRPCSYGQVPLHAVIHKDSTLDLLYLLHKGANPNIPDSKGIFPLYHAVSRSVADAVQLLLKCNADPNSTGDGQTALHAAIIISNEKFVQPLLEAGANPLLTDNHGLNALEFAELKQKEALIPALKQGAVRFLSKTTPDTERNRKERKL